MREGQVELGQHQEADESARDAPAADARSSANAFLVLGLHLLWKLGQLLSRFFYLDAAGVGHADDLAAGRGVAAVVVVVVVVVVVGGRGAGGVLVGVVGGARGVANVLVVEVRLGCWW